MNSALFVQVGEGATFVGLDVVLCWLAVDVSVGNLLGVGILVVGEIFGGMTASKSSMRTTTCVGVVTPSSAASPWRLELQADRTSKPRAAKIKN